MLTVSNLAKHIAFLAAMIDSERITEQQTRIFVGSGVPRATLPFDADIDDALRHLHHTALRCWTLRPNSPNNQALHLLRSKIEAGAIGVTQFEDLFEQRFPPGRSGYGGASVFATTIAYLPAALFAHRIRRDELDALCRTSHGYFVQEHDPDMSAAFVHVRKTLEHVLGMRREEATRTVMNLMTKIRTGDLTTNSLDAAFERGLTRA